MERPPRGEFSHDRGARVFRVRGAATFVVLRPLCGQIRKRNPIEAGRSNAGSVRVPFKAGRTAPCEYAGPGLPPLARILAS